MGMLLAALTDSAGTTAINLDEQFTKLCGRDFVTKVVNVCRGINWKDLLPRLDGESQIQKPGVGIDHLYFTVHSKDVCFAS